MWIWLEKILGLESKLKKNTFLKQKIIARPGELNKKYSSANPSRSNEGWE